MRHQRPLHTLTLLICSCCCLIGAAATSAHAQQVAVEEFTLDNGMTFLLLPRHEEPNTITAGWVAKVGSVNERPGITGISHFFEHMMFKGTTTIGTSDLTADRDFMTQQEEIKDELNRLIWEGQYERYRLGEIDDPWDPANDTDEVRDLRRRLREQIELHRGVIMKNEFDRIYTEAGASGMNAFTDYDMTFYFITVPSNKFELWAWMESDRLLDSVFREFYAERDVVHEERRMRLESSPTGELDEAFDAMFWTASPYSWPVIGWPSDLRSYTRAQAEEYYDIYYRPNNLVGMIVGDFDPAEIKPMLRAYFSRLERGERTPPPVVTLEVEQVGQKRMLGECDCQPQLEYRYHTVPFNHRDSFALDVLAALLNGRTGRLYKSMIEGAEIASRAIGSQESRKYGGYFTFRAEVRGDATPADLENAWLEQLERLKNEPVPADELQKVKNQIAADAYRRLQSNSALLFQLGIYEALGGWEYINNSSEKLMAVTADDISRVAKTYLNAKNSAVAEYTRRPPQATEDKAGGDADIWAAREQDAFGPLPAERRQQMKAALDRLLENPDPAQVRQIAQRMELALAMAPPDSREAIAYFIERLNAHANALEAGGDVDVQP